jgi:uncharacterized protein YkwD
MARESGPRARGRWLRVTALTTLAALCMGAAPAVAQGSGIISVTVTLPDGSPASNATIFLNDARVQAGPDGRWRGPLPTGGRIYEAAATAGFASRGLRWSDAGSMLVNGQIVLSVNDQLASVFDVSTDAYLPGTIPPLIAQFVTDTGVSEQQEVPGETTSVSVSGGVGALDGHPFVRGDGWLALPDESVKFVPVTLNGDEFSATFPFDQGPGRYQVEINDTSGGAVINVPMFVGVPYTPDMPVWPLMDNPAPDASAHQTLDALNQLRSRHGLAELKVDPRLEAIADDHMADLVAHHWYCHCWADGSSIVDHVQAANIAVSMRPSVIGPPGSQQYGVGEGFASFEGEAAISQLFTSPGHRHDLLGDWTAVGIASSPDPGLPGVIIEYAAEK